MRSILAVACVCTGMTVASTANAQEILVNRYDVLIQRDKLTIFEKTTKEADTKEGRAIIGAACVVLGCDPSKINAGIAGAAKLIVPRGKEDMSGVINSPPGYTICYAVTANPKMKSGMHGIESHGDSTFSVTLFRPVPGVTPVDGLAWNIVVPYKASTDTRVNGVFDVAWVKADPGWQQKFPQCRRTFEHPWLARNNHTRINVPCQLAPNFCKAVPG